MREVTGIPPSRLTGVAARATECTRQHPIRLAETRAERRTHARIYPSLTDSGFASFFQERFSRTVLLLIAMGASRADAEDAAQEAMILAWKRWDTIGEPTAWVRTVAVRAYWKLLRTRTLTVPLDESTPEPVSNSDLDMFGEQEQVLQLIRGLPPRQRTVIALYYDGSTCKKITELTGMPEGTVRSHLRHGRRALRGVIASEVR